MTTLTSDEYQASRAGQTSTSASDNGYAEHMNNRPSENGYAVDSNDLPTSNHSSQTGGYSQGSGGSGSKPEDERKLFVGGLTWDTTQDDLREYFSSFGHIVDCSIKHDPSTGRSRGFAFLVFDSKEIVEKILAQNDHFVKGRKVDPKPAHRRLNANNHTMTNSASTNNHLGSQAYYGVPSSSSMSYANLSGGANANPYNNNRKVFIGGLDPAFPDSQLREYFSKFGKIDEIDLPYDKEKNERRPFCFISFQTEQAAQEVLRLQRHTIGDMSVDVKRAKPKTMNNQQQQLLQQQQQQHMYDPYGQQTGYGNYGGTVSSYGVGAYPPNDGYAHWNAYTYNQQANPAAYSYVNSGSANAPSSGTSSYSQYADAPSTSQYPYVPPNTANTNEYYSQYGYGASQSTGVYNDPNTYGNGNYEYGSYYAPMNAGASGSMNDNGSGQPSGNSPGHPAEYEHDNHYGKAKTSIVSSPTYHPYSRT